MSRQFAPASLLILILLPRPTFCAPPPRPDPIANFRQSLEKLRAFSPEPCGMSDGKDPGWQTSKLETPAFDSAAAIVLEQLNAVSAVRASPRDRATEALQSLQRTSAELNAEWPKERRFQFEILDLPPALVIKMTLRAHSRFFVFGVPEQDSAKPNQLWHNVGSDDTFLEKEVPWTPLELYPLYRGPSGNTRFLAKFILSGCAGSIGVVYDAREWDPNGDGSLEQIIKQSGSFGLDDKVKGFEWIGTLQTKGPLVTLPYCWFSAIDTWDNPSLCAADTYDLSGDDVRFKSHADNRPDLVPIAKAVEYAQQHDYPAALAYCASSEVARKLVRDVFTHIFADDLRVKLIVKGKEHVEFGFDRAYRFDVEARNGRWLIVAFSTQ